MSKPSSKKPSKVTVGSLDIPTRITVTRLARVTEATGVDYATQDTKPMLEFMCNPAVVAEVAYYLYKDHIEKKGLSQDDFDDLIGPEECEALRAEVVQQMRGFSAFWKIIATEMEGILSGSTNLLDLAKANQALPKKEDPSGPSS